MTGFDLVPRSLRKDTSRQLEGSFVLTDAPHATLPLICDAMRVANLTAM